jgi:hypothetical protein
VKRYTSLFESTESAKKIASALRDFYLPKRGYPGAERITISDDGRYVDYAIRNWGSWGSSPERYGEEDDDFEILDASDLKLAKNTFETWIKKQSWFKEIKDFHVSPEEKNYLIFTVYLK